MPSSYPEAKSFQKPSLAGVNLLEVFVNANSMRHEYTQIWGHSQLLLVQEPNCYRISDLRLQLRITFARDQVLSMLSSRSVEQPLLPASCVLRPLLMGR